MPRQYIRGTVSERFWPKVDTSGECWPWRASTYSNGYGSFRDTSGHRGAHVVAWRLAGGRALVSGEGIYHTCDLRPCVRNDDLGTYIIDGVPHERRGHLWIGTQADNMRDMQVKGRGALGDRNSSRLRPERLPRGDRHPAKVRNGDYFLLGEDSQSAKLKTADVVVIRADYAGGARLSELARRFHVTESAIRAIVRGKSWRHIDGADPLASPRLQHATSAMPGVDWNRRAGKWRARVRIDGQDRHLGLFTSEAEAGAAVQAARNGAR